MRFTRPKAVITAVKRTGPSFFFASAAAARTAAGAQQATHTNGLIRRALRYAVSPERQNPVISVTAEERSHFLRPNAQGDIKSGVSSTTGGERKA